METLPSWKKVWREGFAPCLSTQGLEALRKGLERDDPRIIQGATTTPPPLQCVQDWPVEAACALGYCGWQGEELETVGQVEEFFARVCFEADQRLGEPAACRWFLNWFDDSPRGDMQRGLIAEIEYVLDARQQQEEDTRKKLLAEAVFEQRLDATVDEVKQRLEGNT